MSMNFSLPMGLDPKEITRKVDEVQAAAKVAKPQPRPARNCNYCDQPLIAIVAGCQMHAREQRLYHDEFYLRGNASEKLSEVTAEEFRLEERDRELLAAADFAKEPNNGMSREQREGNLTKIFGYDFPTNATRHLDRPTMEHKPGLLDIVRARLAEIRTEMPKLVRIAEAYLAEQRSVPTDLTILAQKRAVEKVEQVLR